jgi:hypothetical protein
MVCVSCGRVFEKVSDVDVGFSDGKIVRFEYEHLKLLGMDIFCAPCVMNLLVSLGGSSIEKIYECHSN